MLAASVPVVEDATRGMPATSSTIRLVHASALHQLLGLPALRPWDLTHVQSDQLRQVLERHPEVFRRVLAGDVAGVDPPVAESIRALWSGWDRDDVSAMLAHSTPARDIPRVLASAALRRLPRPTILSRVLERLRARARDGIPASAAIAVSGAFEAFLDSRVEAYTDFDRIRRQPTGAEIARSDASRGRIIVTPPVAQTNWASEIQRCRVPEHLDDAPIVLIRAGRKVTDLPATGIVTDSLLAAPTRRPLLEDLKAWGADVLIYDEVHRAKNWHSRRAKVVRELATTATDRMVLTGNPVMSNPADLPSLLAITGQLQPVFGSRTAFMNRYTRTYEIPVGRQTIEKIVPNKKHLPELGRVLPEQVWVRRTKDQVLPDLPEKQYSTMIVDVPTTEYRTATRDVQAKITAYLGERARELGAAPSEREVRAWCSDQMGCVSMLRHAAGLAKIPAAAEYIADWVDSTTHHDGETTVFDRPLIVWGIHQTVMNTLDAHLDQLGVPRAVINGSTSLTQRDRITRDYQDGKSAVILANIVAAGVAITLTRGSDALFVETEWLPDLVSQAVDRQHRIGQKRTVTITTMVAPGTLDHTIQKVQRTNIDVLDELVGGTGHHVAVEEDDMSSLAIGDEMWELAEPLRLNMRSEAPREAML